MYAVRCGAPSGLSTRTTSLIISRTCPPPAHSPWSGGSRSNPAYFSLSFSLRPSHAFTAPGLLVETGEGDTFGIHDGDAVVASFRAPAAVRTTFGRGELL